MDVLSDLIPDQGVQEQKLKIFILINTFFYFLSNLISDLVWDSRSDDGFKFLIILLTTGIIDRGTSPLQNLPIFFGVEHRKIVLLRKSLIKKFCIDTPLICSKFWRKGELSVVITSDGGESKAKKFLPVSDLVLNWLNLIW